MFERIEPGGVLHLDFEGRPIAARAGDSVASALLAANVLDFHASAVSGTPRAPYCMMGVCFECTVEIDGIGGRQACLTRAVNGMRIRREAAARTLA